MKQLLLVFSVLFSLGFGSGKANAYPLPYVYRGWFGGYYSSWGYFPWYRVGAFPLYGYSYWPAFNYASFYSSFGAISISKTTGRYGVSWGKPNGQIAMINANAHCGVADCAPIVWVQGGCAAVAKSPTGQNLAWGYHAFKDVAFNNALEACNASNGAGCKIHVWVCSY